jgi:hypothetical protein
MSESKGTSRYCINEIQKYMRLLHQKHKFSCISLFCSPDNVVEAQCDPDMRDLVSKMRPSVTMPAAREIAVTQRQLVSMDVTSMTFSSLPVAVQRQLLLELLNVVISKRKSVLKWDAAAAAVSERLPWWPEGIAWQSPKGMPQEHLDTVMTAIGEHYEAKQLRKVIPRLSKVSWDAETHQKHVRHEHGLAHVADHALQAAQDAVLLLSQWGVDQCLVPASVVV